MVSLMVSRKCFLFIYMYINIFQLKAYKLFENSDADLSQLVFNPFPNKPWFLRICSTSLLKTWREKEKLPWFLRICSTSLLKTWREKEKLLVTSNFSFSLSVFYPFRELSAIVIKFKSVVCKIFHFGRV